MDRKLEDTVVATSTNERAPEHRMSLVLRRDFTRDQATTTVTLELPFGVRVELSESQQLEVLQQLLQQAIPAVREAETRLGTHWRRWCRALEGRPKS